MYAGETEQEALGRECHEELNVTIGAPGRLIETVGEPGIALSIYLVHDWVGEPRNAAVEEHDQIRWFHADELHTVHLADHRYHQASRRHRHRRPDNEASQLVTIGFIAFHYPDPSHRDEMIDRIRHVVDVLTAQPGCLGAECWLSDTSDGEAVVSSGRWQSAADRDAGFAAARAAGADFHFDEREVRPRRRWDLTEPKRP